MNGRRAHRAWRLYGAVFVALHIASCSAPGARTGPVAERLEVADHAFARQEWSSARSQYRSLAEMESEVDLAARRRVYVGIVACDAKLEGDGAALIAVGDMVETFAFGNLSELDAPEVVALGAWLRAEGFSASASEVENLVARLRMPG